MYCVGEYHTLKLKLPQLETCTKFLDPPLRLALDYQQSSHLPERLYIPFAYLLEVNLFPLIPPSA